MKFKNLCLLIAVLFAFEVFAQEGIAPDFEPESPDASESFAPPEIIQSSQELPQIKIPQKKKTAIDKLKAVPEARMDARTENSKVFLDFRDADIKEVMRVLSKISGANILVSEDVKAKVTLNIAGVPWKNALKLILRTYNLTMIEKDDFIIVVTYKQIQEEQKQIPLVTAIITLNFVDIDDAKTYLKSVLTKGRGKIEGDPRTNSLIITDIPEAIEKAKQIVRQLDKKTLQVLIEVLMVDVKVEDDFSLGINWSFTDTRHEGTGLGLDRDISQTLPLSSAAMALTYGKILSGYARLQAEIKALGSNQKVNIIANPKILTLNNEVARIEIIEQIPYTSETRSSEGGTSTSTQFKDAGVTLEVKPHITPDGHIILDVQTKQSFRTGFTPGDNEPIINSRTSQSTMMILDGQTIVIGGLRKKDDVSTITKVPFLGDIPWLGKLFSREVSAYITREFLIFITPTVVKEAMEIAGSGENERSLRKQVFHDQKMRRNARAALKYDDFAEEAQRKAEKARLKEEKKERKQSKKEKQRQLKRQKKEEDKKSFAEFDNLDILPVKGPDETN